MRLFELDDQNALATKIVAAADQLKFDLENGNVEPNWSLDQLLKYFQNYGVILDPTDLYNMIKQRPLKDVITNIQGDKVVFKGQSNTNQMPKDQSKEVVAKMAQSAMPAQ